METTLEAACRILRGKKRVIVFTGAGVSVPSGIPDFRSGGGLWERFPPERYATIDAFLDDPERVWEMNFALFETIRGVAPNPAHMALARLEALGIVASLVTQNIDRLHQRAGSREVVELHGSGAHLVCLGCGNRTGAPPEIEARVVPRCTECGRVMKPDVVYFGEMLPEGAMERAAQAAANADACIVAGTSAVVYPAATIPRLAWRSGAPILEFNLSPTELTLSGCVHCLVEGSVDETLPALVEILETPC